MTTDLDRKLSRLLHSLTREFFQTETSALKHCTREGERLGHEVAPAIAMLALADAANEALKQFPKIAAGHGLPVSGVGMTVGAIFSEVRDKLADRMIRAERSYRGTLLGLRHGVDLVRLLNATAAAANYTDLVSYCAVWSEQRVPLVERAEREVTWFARHPRAAIERPRFRLT